MNKRTVLNIGLLLFVAGLGALLWLHPGKRNNTKKTRVIALHAKDIHSIRIREPNSKEVELVKKGKLWMLVKPIHTLADGVLVDSLLSGLSESSAAHYKAASLDLKKVGLNPPKLDLWLNKEHIQFGATEPLNYQRYIKIGNTVHLANDMLYYRLTGDPGHWADKHLLPAKAKITAIQLPDHTISLGKNGKWQLVPKDPDIPADSIQRLVNDWQTLDAIDVASLGDQEKFSGEVSIGLQGEKTPLRFGIIEGKSNWWLARPDLHVKYELYASAHDELLKLARSNPADKSLKPIPKPPAKPGNKKLPGAKPSG